ncbi:hypothetical protein [Pontibacter sp. SGAir0037]|uniref:hypothetical protein n=1 Tax=Pontibacter sp. SGAir0037 TaxID=2571030 RepID=UPI0010CCD095|nr:hypothetical protein [Pontibacter sp. SGAir0037]QCR22062.1 hypothetical protein C1N53_06720 [Pontibacter sp. SGAir0037]
MSEHAKASFGRKALKFTGIVLACVVGLILLAHLALLFLAEPLAEKYLKKGIANSSDGLYKLEFENLTLSLLSGQVAIENLHLSYDSTLHVQQVAAGKAGRYLVDIKAPLFSIDHVNFIDIIFNKHVGIKTILLDRPEVRLTSDDQVQKQNEQEKETALTDFIRSFSIKEININDGTYHYTTFNKGNLPRHDLHHATLQIMDFRLDSLDQPDHTRLFEADDVQLTAGDYEYHSPDSVYAVRMAHLAYSSKQGELTLKGFEVISNHQANMALAPEESSRSIYDLKVPLLKVTGLDVVEAYKSKQLLMQEVELNEAALSILKNSNIPSATDQPQLKDLYADLSPYLKAVGVASFSVNDGYFILRNKIDEITTIHELQKADIAVRDILLDSVSLFHTREKFFLQAVELAAKDYRYQHPQSPYNLAIGSCRFSSSDQLIQLESINLEGDTRKNDRLKTTGHAVPVVYSLQANRLKINNTDLLEAYKTERLSLDKVVLQQPAITAVRDLHLKSESAEKTLRETYAALSGFVKQISLNALELQDGSLTHYTKKNTVSRTQKLAHATLIVRNMELDSVFFYAPEERLPMQDIVLQVRDYTYTLPDHTQSFYLGSVYYSSLQKKLTAQTIRVSSDPEANERLKHANTAKPYLFDIAATMLSIDEIDLLESYRSKNLQVNEVVLQAPDLNILQDRDIVDAQQNQDEQAQASELFQVINHIRVNAIRLRHGTFTLRENKEKIIRTQVLKQASATLLNLNLTPQTVNSPEDKFPIDDLILTAQDYSYHTPNGLYTFLLDSIHYSTQKQELFARSIKLRSNKDANDSLKQENQASRNLFNVSAANFSIKGLDIIQSYQTGRFNISEIILNEPEVAILQDQRVVAGSQQEDEEAILGEAAEVVETFQVNRLRISDGNFQLKVLEDTIVSSQSLAEVSLVLEGLRAVSMQTNDPLEMFTAANLGLHLQNYTYTMPDSLYVLEVGEITSSLREQSLQIKNVSFTPLLSREDFTKKLPYSSDRYEIHVPLIQLLDIDTKALFNMQDILVHRINVHDPVIDIYRDNRVPRDPNKKPFTIQKMLRQIKAYLLVDSAAVYNGKLTYSEISPNGLKPGQLVLDDMHLRLSNITNDSVLIGKKNFLTAKGVTQLMGKSELKVQFLFDLNHPEDKYSYEGTLQRMNFEEFNPLLENIAFIKFESGKINHVNFKVNATEHLATGQINFYYQNLDLQLVKKDNPAKPGFFLNAASYLLNHMVLKSNNPRRKGNFREGTIEVERDYQKSVFNHMSKAMINGIATSLMPPLVEKVAGLFMEF